MTLSGSTIRLADNAVQNKWDQYVSTHPDASPYHLFAWKKAVEQAYGHKGLYLLAERNSIITGVLPVIHMRLPFLVDEFAALPFCDVGNILANNDQVAELLLREALNLSQNNKTRKINLRGTMNVPTALADKIFLENNDKVRMLLDLPISSGALMEGFKSKLRSQIRKSENNGLTFLWGNKEHLSGFYAVFAENMRDLGSPTHSDKWFAAVLDNYGKNAELGIVKYGQKIVAGCLILSVADKVSIPWASTLRSYNKLAPNMLLYWNVLKYASDAGFTTFDFGRSSLEEGTYKFKKQWGASAVPLLWYTTSSQKTLSTDLDFATHRGNREKLVRAWQKLPLPLANFLGPVLRKYISL